MTKTNPYEMQMEKGYTQEKQGMTIMSESWLNTQVTMATNGYFIKNSLTPSSYSANNPIQIKSPQRRPCARVHHTHVPNNT